MTSRSLLIPAIVVAVAALGASHNALSEPIDAQSHAAALLSGVRTPVALEAHGNGDASSSSVFADAHASAAALLSGRSANGRVKTAARVDAPSALRTRTDAQAQAAALLSGSRTRGKEPMRVTAR
jgi:hypothetical protein